MECFGNAPDAQGMTVVPCQYPEVSEIIRCQSAWAREGPWEYARAVRAGPLQNVIPWSGEAMVCDSGQVIDKIGLAL